VAELSFLTGGDGRLRTAAFREGRDFAQHKLCASSDSPFSGDAKNKAEKLAGLLRHQWSAARKAQPSPEESPIRSGGNVSQKETPFCE